NCLVLDFTDQGHSLDAVVNLSKAIPEARVDREKSEEQEDADQEGLHKENTIEISRECDQEFDILGGARFMWVDIGDGDWSLADDNGHEIVMSPKESGYVAVVYFADTSMSDIVQKPLTLDYCQGICEDFARKYMQLSMADTKAAWVRTGEEATERQRNYLIKKGAYREGISKAQASVEIRKIMGQQNKKNRAIASEQITERQKWFLNSYGISTNNMNRLEAIRKISELKQFSMCA
ncbi:MAG: hypothetical protein JSR46_07045, partial [Verrucomicrobia bacterium]|nr:hypothetical protein [Verrucomicrobiota bacterium]